MSTLEMGQPTGCLQEKPTSTSVILGGKHINILAISRQTNIDQSYLCKILRGKKHPTMETGIKIASALGMTVEEFMMAIQDRIKQIEAEAIATTQKYYDRIIDEDSRDLAKLKRGGIPRPRIPGSRL